MKVVKTVFPAILPGAMEPQAFHKHGGDFTSIFIFSVLFLIFAGLFYFMLHSLWRICNERKGQNFKLLIKNKRAGLLVWLILLAAPCTLWAFPPGVLNSLSGLVTAAVITVMIGGGVYFLSRRLWLAGKDLKAEGLTPRIASRMAGWSCALFLLPLLIAIATYTPPADYRSKALEAAALSDLRDARKCLEAYRQEHKKYPDTLEQGGCGGQSKYVEVVYVKTGLDKYRTTSSPKHPGTREYMADSDDPAIYWRPMNEADAKWQRM